MTESVSL